MSKQIVIPYTKIFTQLESFLNDGRQEPEYSLIDKDINLNSNSKYDLVLNEFYLNTSFGSQGLDVVLNSELTLTLKGDEDPFQTLFKIKEIFLQKLTNLNQDVVVNRNKTDKNLSLRYEIRTMNDVAFNIEFIGIENKPNTGKIVLQKEDQVLYYKDEDTPLVQQDEQNFLDEEYKLDFEITLESLIQAIKQSQD